MLNIEDSLLLIIDIQEKLVNACPSGENSASNSIKLAKAAKILNIPIVVTEQYPQGLGATILNLSEITHGISYKVEKNSFSAISELEIKEILTRLKRKQIVICGIETHICVLQTAEALINLGYEVFIANDCVSSRKATSHETGLSLAKQQGAKITNAEIILFEWLKTSKHPKFKEIQTLIK